MADTNLIDQPLVSPACAQTMLRDFEAHRKAVRSGDFTAIDQTWDRCERWVDQLRPDTATALEAAKARIAELEIEVKETQEKLRLADMHCEVLANDCDELRAALQPEHKEGE